MVHLTNNCFQKKHKLYKQRKDESIATWLLLEKEVGCDAIQGIRHRIKRILLAVYAAARRKLIAKKGTY